MFHVMFCIHLLTTQFPYHSLCRLAAIRRVSPYIYSGAGTAYPSGVPQFTLGFSWIRVAQYLECFAFCVVFCG